MFTIVYRLYYSVSALFINNLRIYSNTRKYSTPYRFRAMEVRDVSRQTLSTIANSLGPVYLGYILTELRGALTKGYQLHVLAYTLHHLLIHLELKPADIDNSTLQIITEVSARITPSNTLSSIT